MPTYKFDIDKKTNKLEISTKSEKDGNGGILISCANDIGDNVNIDAIVLEQIHQQLCKGKPFDDFDREGMANDIWNALSIAFDDEKPVIQQPDAQQHKKRAKELHQRKAKKGMAVHIENPCPFRAGTKMAKTYIAAKVMNGKSFDELVTSGIDRQYLNNFIKTGLAKLVNGE